MKIDIEPTALGVPDAAMAVADWALECRLNRMDCFRLRIAVAEALNNIILHGQGAEEAHHRIVIECQDDAQKLSVSVSQLNGPPITVPTVAEIPGPLSESGRGWPIMFQWLDEVSSDHCNGQNVLTLVKHL